MSDLKKWAEDLDRAADTMVERASLVVRKTAFDTAADAQAFAPVDTGFLRSSVVVEVGNGGLRAEVAATANYAVYVEYPTRFQPARPFMRPAKERNTPNFIAAMEQVVAGE